MQTCYITKCVVQGSGYLTACFSYATQPASYVLGVEKFEDVALNSIRNLNAHNHDLLEQHDIDIRAGNIYDIVGAARRSPSGHMPQKPRCLRASDN